MTTIAYHHGDRQVAVDSRYTRGGVIDSDKGCKTRKDDRGLWVFAGSSADFGDLMALYHNDKVTVKPDCGAILISQGKAFTVDTDEGGYCIVAELTCDYAFGSGGHFALAAMDFGKSAKEAVDYAKTRDTYTGRS